MVLYVCTGNTCRSIMAQAVHEWTFGLGTALSAGLAAHRGEPANPKAVWALSQKEIVPHTRTSRPVAEALLAQAETVFGMTEQHAAVLRQRFPAQAAKVQTLGSLAGLGDIADPYGGGCEVYETALAQIMACVAAMVVRA